MSPKRALKMKNQGSRFPTTKKNIVTSLILLALIFPWLDSNPYHIDVLVTSGVFMLLALGLNVIVGYAGVLNLGFAALYAVGAYTYALLSIYLHVPFWIGLWLSAFMSAYTARSGAGLRTTLNNPLAPEKSRRQMAWPGSFSSAGCSTRNTSGRLSSQRAICRPDC